MKLFSRKPTHEEKIDSLHNILMKQKLSVLFFPYGKKQLTAVIESLAVINGIDLKKCDESAYRDILMIYIDVVGKKQVEKISDDAIKQSMQQEHSRYITDEEKAALSLAYIDLCQTEGCLTIQNLSQLKAKMDESKKKAESIFSNIKNDHSYGLSAGNPICVESLEKETEYLESLMTDKGEALYWWRDGSLSMILGGVKGVPVDKYKLLLPDGTLYKGIYICPYAKNYNKAPLGTLYKPGYRKDDNFKGDFVKIAEDAGMTPEQFFEYLKISSEEKSRAIKEVQKKYSQFNLETEKENPLFNTICSAGFSMLQAYEYLHKEDLFDTTKSEFSEMRSPNNPTEDDYFNIIKDIEDADYKPNTIARDEETLIKEAQKEGMGLEQYKAYIKLVEENHNILYQRRAQNYKKWAKEAQLTKQKYPSFDLKAEYNNARFVNALPTIGVLHAFELIHFNELFVNNSKSQQRKNICSSNKEEQSAHINSIDSEGMMEAPVFEKSESKKIINSNERKAIQTAPVVDNFYKELVAQQLRSIEEIQKGCAIDLSSPSIGGMELMPINCEMVYEIFNEEIHFFMQYICGMDQGVYFSVKKTRKQNDYQEKDGIREVTDPTAILLEECSSSPDGYEGPFKEQYQTMWNMISDKKAQNDAVIQERYKIQEQNEKMRISGYQLLEPISLSIGDISDYIELIGENQDYLVYNYSYDKEKCILRISKKNISEIVYLGEAHTFNCFFKGYLFGVNTKSAFFSDHELVQIDIVTGETIEHKIFGKGKIIDVLPTGAAHEICQDKVLDMYVEENELLVLEVHREEGSLNREINENHNENVDYRIEVTVENGELRETKVFPQTEQTIQQNDYDDDDESFIDEITAKFQAVQASVDCIITEREEKGYPAGAPFQIAYFVMFVNLFRDVSVITERESIYIMNLYRLSIERQLSSDGVTALQHFENVYSKIREESDLSRVVERFAYYVEQEFSSEKKLDDEVIMDRLLTVIHNVRDTLSVIMDDEEFDNELKTSDLYDKDKAPNEAEKGTGIEEKTQIAEKTNKSHVTTNEYDLFALLKKNVEKYAENISDPTAQERLAAMVITYSSTIFNDDTIFAYSGLLYSETIIYTSFYVTCHILNNCDNKEIPSSALNRFFEIIGSEIVESTDIMNSEKMYQLWQDRWGNYQSLVDPTGDIDEYLTIAQISFGEFLRYDKNHSMAYRDRFISAEDILGSAELHGAFEVLQEQICIDAYAHSLDSVFGSAIQDVIYTL